MVEKGIFMMTTTDGIMFPSSARMYLSPIHNPAFHQKRIFFFDNPINGVNIRTLKKHSVREFTSKCARTVEISPDTLVLKDGIMFKDFLIKKMTKKELRDINCNFEFEIRDHIDSFHGIATWFDVTFKGSDNSLSPIVLSTHPSNLLTHWKQSFFPFPKPLILSAKQQQSQQTQQSHQQQQQQQQQQQSQPQQEQQSQHQENLEQQQPQQQSQQTQQQSHQQQSQPQQQQQSQHQENLEQQQQQPQQLQQQSLKLPEEITTPTTEILKGTIRVYQMQWKRHYQVQLNLFSNNKYVVTPTVTTTSPKSIARTHFFEWTI